jgi:hypothetical protein
VERRRSAVVDGLGRPGRGFSIVPSELLNVAPEWQKPRLKIVESHVRIKGRSSLQPES